ncbi:RIP metalloprotease [bacterium]|nr:MAG: RIP metalloprotease [bacterium]
MSPILLYPLYALVLVTVLSVLVAAHEYGHYIFARLFGMGAEEFAIGMGKPRLITWFRRTYTVPLPADAPYREGEMVEASAAGMNFEKADQPIRSEVVRTHKGLALAETTEFTIRPYPVGGFVRIKGMMPEEDGSETKIPGGFYSKPPWQRFIVLLAGPAFSILAGIFLLTGVLFTQGGIDSSEPTIGGVSRTGAARQASLRPDDKILSIDGKPVRRFYDIVSAVRDSPGQKFLIEFDRAGVRKTTEVVPIMESSASFVLNEDMEPTGERRLQAKLGIQPFDRRVKMSLADSFGKAWRAPITNVKAIYFTFKRPEQIKENLGGPGSIAATTAMAVDSGFVTVLTFAAMLSISVGIFNLLPIFPLDGGQMMVALAEMLRGGKRLSMRVQNMVGTLGFALVVTLFVGVLLIDANRFVFSRFGEAKPAEPKIEMELSEKMKNMAKED